MTPRRGALWRRGDVTTAMRLALALFLVLAPLGAAAEPFRLGVRSDARPFVFSDAGRYRGFLYDMCRAAIARAGVADADVDLVPVTAADRFEKAASLDLLCDPTTLTVERARQWTFTPIVFYANATALRRTRLRRSRRPRRPLAAILAPSARYSWPAGSRARRQLAPLPHSTPAL